MRFYHQVSIADGSIVERFVSHTIKNDKRRVFQSAEDNRKAYRLFDEDSYKDMEPGDEVKFSGQTVLIRMF